jgi:hypothetical protein
LRKQCQNQRGCNYLHVFKDPDNEFRYLNYNIGRSRPLERTVPEEKADAKRWSSSPELQTSSKTTEDASQKRKKSKKPKKEGNKKSHHRKRHKRGE